MSRLNFTNYDFETVSAEMVTGRLAYVLEVKPKRKEKYLFQGRIWVDAEDYALVRAEGSPSEKWAAVVSTLHAKRYRRSFLRHH
jgi:outer membrane lipoprotein-sorting protein